MQGGRGTRNPNGRAETGSATTYEEQFSVGNKAQSLREYIAGPGSQENSLNKKKKQKTGCTEMYSAIRTDKFDRGH